MKAKGFAHSVIGGREKNQDAFLADDSILTYAVADGIGGGHEGEVASKMAVEGIQQSPGAEFQPLVKTLQEKVLKYALEKFGDPLMGTTLTVARLEGEQIHLCHIGDSRCYLYDGTTLRQMTTDHEAYDDNNQGTVLVSYLGIDTATFPLQIQEEKFSVSPGNKLILCSDGLYKQVTESRVAELIQQQGSDPKKLLETLCNEAATQEYSDNVTIVYVEFE